MKRMNDCLSGSRKDKHSNDGNGVSSVVEPTATLRLEGHL